MTKKELEEYIENISSKGSILGLDTEKELLGLMGNPENKLKFIHIAGTNGKGSILAFTSTILQCAGLKVGRYISPVISEYREKIQINGKNISEASLLEGMEYIKSLIDKAEITPTIFEIETALAFWYFDKKKCDIVVLETGLGGRDDATNVIPNSICSVFASISMDHMAVLGKTIEEISRVKAGIIKDNSSVITAKQPDVVLEILKDTAHKHNCEFITATNPTNVKLKLNNSQFDLGEMKKLSISLMGAYQPGNAAVALAVVKSLRNKGYNISDEAIRRGLKECSWFGRFSLLSQKPLFICDGAHNEDASIRLADSINCYFKDKELIFILGVFKDKEYEKLIANTAYLAKHIITVTVPNLARALPSIELANAVKEYNANVTAASSIEEAVEIASLLASKDCVIIAFGSLSYLGRLREIVKNKKKLHSNVI